MTNNFETASEIEFKLPGEQTIGKTDVELFPSANADEIGPTTSLQ